jgi:hypothetical protein
VTARHMRQAKLCASGCREFFRREGLSWSDFATGGIAASRLEATGNPYAVKCAALARAEVTSEDNHHG